MRVHESILTLIGRRGAIRIGPSTKKEVAVASFIVLLNWTEQGVKAFKESPSRVDAFNEQMAGLGAKVTDVYWTIGPYDIVAFVEAGDDESATAALLKLGSLGNVRSTTLRAFSRSEFEQIVARAG
jgi:uncharacterized protein with GYD domain